MKTLQLESGYTIRYYNGLDELPAERLSFLTRYSLESALLPTTHRDIGEAIQQISGYVQAAQTADALVALQNLYVGVMAIYGEYIPDAYEFGCFIHDVDGVPVVDMSPEGLGPIMNKLAMPVEQMARLLDDLKKNSDTSDTYISLGLTSLD